MTGVFDVVSLILPTGEADEWEVNYDLIALGEEIGSGAFGTVCKASVSSLPGYPDQSDVVVAVKTLKGDKINHNFSSFILTRDLICPINLLYVFSKRIKAIKDTGSPIIYSNTCTYFMIGLPV